ncbi:MAG: VTT domain-containing protein [Candidatus Nanopelagicales bacterium]
MIDFAQNIALLGINWLDPEYILNWLGPWAMIGLVIIIFAECGLLIGFFLPGDSLLFIAGMFIASGAISTPLWLALVVLWIAAFVGNLCGYWIGAAVGPKLFDKPDSRFFKAEYVEKTHEFFEKWGARAIILARFVPIVRTFITAIAGVGRMDFRKYALYSGIGALLWAVCITILGYFLGNIPFIKNNIEFVAIFIVFLSIIPIIAEVLRARRNRDEKEADEIDRQAEAEGD